MSKSCCGDWRQWGWRRSGIEIRKHRRPARFPGVGECKSAGQVVRRFPAGVPNSTVANVTVSGQTSLDLIVQDAVAFGRHRRPSEGALVGCSPRGVSRSSGTGAPIQPPAALTQHRTNENLRIKVRSRPTRRRAGRMSMTALGVGGEPREAFSVGEAGSLDQSPRDAPVRSEGPIAPVARTTDTTASCVTAGQSSGSPTS